MNTDSAVAVGELVSAFDLYRCWGLPSAQTLPFMEPFLFCFRNISYFSALRRISSVISVGSSGFTTFLS